MIVVYYFKALHLDLFLAGYLSLNRRFTKSVLGALTRPFLFILRLRFLDFFVKMWRLKAFWKVILPVPVTLNLFLALEFVLTLGIFCSGFTIIPCWRIRTGGTLMGPFGQCRFCFFFNQQKTDVQNGAQR